MQVIDTIARGANTVAREAVKAFDDYDAMYDATKLFTATVEGLNLPVSKPLMTTCRMFTDLSELRGVVHNSKDLLTGHASGQTEKDRILLADTIFIPNVMKVFSTVSFLIGDISGTLLWLQEIELVKLAELASSVACCPFFSCILDLDAQAIQGRCIIVGFILDIADGFKDIYQSGFSCQTSLRIANDVIKITFVVLKMSHIEGYALIALGVGSGLSLIRFFAFPSH